MHSVNKLRPASPEEMIVNARIFGDCNHRAWIESRDRLNVNLVCTQCGEEYWYSDVENPKQFLSQDAFLLSKIRKYSEEEVLSNVVLRKIEDSGWIAKVKTEDGNHVCSFENDTLVYISKPSTSRAAAICDAAAKLGGAGHFSDTVKVVSNKSTKVR